MIQRYVLIALCGLFLASCSSGQRSLERGQYDLAVAQAVKRLKQKPEHKKASRVLQEAYGHAVDGHMENIRMLDLSDRGDKWEQIALEYEKIAYLNGLVRSYPQYRDLVELVDVTEALVRSQDLAAQEHIERGDALMAIGTPESARDAFYEYDRALYFKPADNTILERMDQARRAGTIRLALEFADKRYIFMRIDEQLAFQELQQRIIRSNYTFLEVLPPGSESEADELVKLEFNEVFIGPPIRTYDEHQMIKDDVFLGKEQVNDSTEKDVYGRVSARVRVYSKTRFARAVLSLERFRVADMQSLGEYRVPSQFEWCSQWATFSGDKRALDQTQLDLLKLREERSPDDQWMFAQITAPLVDDVSGFLLNAYRALR